MSDLAQEPSDDEGLASQARLKLNVAAVCRAVTAAGGGTITSTMKHDGDEEDDEEDIEIDDDLPDGDLLESEEIVVARVDHEGTSEVSIGDAVRSLMRDLSKQLVEFRDDDWRVEATFDAEQFRLSAQSFAFEEYEELRSDLRSVITPDASAPATLADIAMHRIYGVTREIFRKQSKFISDMPGIQTPEQADAWNAYAVLSALKRAGIDRAVLAYAGSGDRGDKWELTGDSLSTEELADRLRSRVALCKHDCHGLLVVRPQDVKLELVTKTLSEAIDMVAEHLVYDHHFGYEEQRGAGGKVVFDVIKDDILWSAFDYDTKAVPKKSLVLDAPPPPSAMPRP